MRTYEITGIEPEPWTAPGHGIGRRNGKVFVQVYSSDTLKAYHEAVREEMKMQNPHSVLETGDLSVQFFFWRSTDSIRKVVDATNLQKALEDALQGILYVNDKSNRRITSEIVEQGEGVTPGIIITIEPYIPSVVAPPKPQGHTRPESVWTPAKDLF